jgi:hypothetical protein
MKHFAVTALVAALVAGLAPTSALAKGAGLEQIAGPGLDEPIVFPRSSQSISIAQASGIYEALFPQAPDPMLDERPVGELGPRYTITWSLFVGNGESAAILQDVYPYARPDPVTYVEPGQPYFAGEAAHGGWFVASPLLKAELVAAGLPPRPPAEGDPEGSPWWILAAFALAGALGGLALARPRRWVAAMRTTRRGQAEA